MSLAVENETGKRREGFTEGVRKLVKRESISKMLRFEVFKRDSFTCQYCGAKSPDVLLVIEHVQPVSKGGDNNVLNLVTACEPCNSGKGPRELSEHSELNKQRNQLAALNEKREQLKLMLEWRQELANLQNDKIEAIISHLAENAPGPTPNETGRKIIVAWIRKFTLDEIFDGISVAFETYNYGDGEEPAVSASWNSAFLNVEKIIRWKRLAAKDPDEAKIRYIAGICANRFGPQRRYPALQLLRAAVSRNVDLDHVEKLAKQAGWWSAFRTPIQQFIEDADAETNS